MFVQAPIASGSLAKASPKGDTLRRDVYDNIVVGRRGKTSPLLDSVSFPQLVLWENPYFASKRHRWTRSAKSRFLASILRIMLLQVLLRKKRAGCSCSQEESPKSSDMLWIYGKTKVLDSLLWSHIFCAVTRGFVMSIYTFICGATLRLGWWCFVRLLSYDPCGKEYPDVSALSYRYVAQYNRLSFVRSWPTKGYL